jgi:hypothetical protein
MFKYKAKFNENNGKLNEHLKLKEFLLDRLFYELDLFKNNKKAQMNDLKINTLCLNNKPVNDN